MNEKCRLCLGILANGPSLSIRDSRLRVELKNAFHFDIAYDVQLPECVCDKCRGTVANINSYCQQVRHNQMQLIEQTKGSSLQPMENVNLKSLYEAKHCRTKQAEEWSSKGDPEDGQVEANSAACSEIDSSVGKGVDSTLEEEKELDKSWRMSSRVVKDTHIVSKKNAKQDSLKRELQEKQQENDQLIKDFFNLECEICSTPLENFVKLLDHYRQVHNTQGYVRCCGKQFFRRYILVDHIAAHRGSTRCEICLKTYKSKRYLLLHIAKSHSSEADRPFKCAKCHLSYPKQYLLRAHELLHVQQQCHICNKVLSNNQSLKVHIAQMHSDDGNHICDTCGKVFRTKPAMERHLNEHRGLDLVQRLQCEHCKKWFSGKYNLNKHIRFLHLQDGKVFPCDVCQHVSPNSRALANHKQRIHVGERFACEYCGKRFKRRPNLREHVATHTNVPLYTCEICQNRTFNSKANYFTHRKNKHPQEWEARIRLRTEQLMNNTVNQ